MEEYNQEIVDLKELVGKALDKKGLLSKIRAQLRASIFEVIEDQDKSDSGPKAVVGECHERAKQYNSTKTGQLLIALLTEYFEWCELEHTSKMFQVEGNLKVDASRTRSKLEEELGLPTNNKVNEPVIARLLDSYMSGKAKTPVSSPQAASATKAASTSAKNARSSSPTVKRESMGATIMRSISPARGHRMGLKSLIPGGKSPQH